MKPTPRSLAEFSLLRMHRRLPSGVTTIRDFTHTIMAGSKTHVVDSVTNFMSNKRYHKHVGIINFQEPSEHIPETSRSHDYNARIG
jgi:hypothetical protein